MNFGIKILWSFFLYADLFFMKLVDVLLIDTDKMFIFFNMYADFISLIGY